jgi:ketosteroid isomerase-like protein
MRLTRAFAAVVAAVAAATTARAQSPQAAVNELLAADRAFSAAGASGDMIESFAAMFVDDVMMPAPPGRVAKGKDDVIAALKANPANANSKAEWSPVRGGISADGLHGFTFGFMTIHKPDGTAVPAKYLAYWVKGPAGWKVAAFKRAPKAPGDVARESMLPSLPPALVAPTTDRATIERHRASLVAAEKGFSDLSNKVGLGNAFEATGNTDAINLGGGGADFVYGNVAIAKSVGGGAPADAKPFTWSADTAFVASSGDLGVTFGLIRQNNPPAGQPAPPAFPFFTIWRKDANGVWKYIAE